MMLNLFTTVERTASAFRYNSFYPSVSRLGEEYESASKSNRFEITATSREWVRQ